MCGPPREQCIDFESPKSKEREWDTESQYISDCISRDLGASEKEIAHMYYRGSTLQRDK